MTREFKTTMLWLVAVAVAAVAQLDHADASFFGGAYHPVGNDSFYHARRILDSAADPTAFYEFDPKIHAPEGSLITWPWGYDYAMAMIVRGVTHLMPGSDPLTILVHIPTAAVIVSVSLIMAIAAMLGLSSGYVLLAGVATGLSPLTQGLHGVGNIDQHFAEYMAVLGALAAGMAWLRAPGRHGFAALTGFVLGIAPAIHSALFILQLPLLLTGGLIWLKGQLPPTRDVGVFAGAFLLATAVVTFPSEPVRLGLFEYYRLSWFQLYVAGCTTAILLFMTTFRARSATVVALIVACVLLCIPLLSSLHHAGAFFSREIAMNRTLQETQSVRELMSGPGGLRRGIGYYSGFLMLLPFSLGLCMAGLVRSSRADRILFFVTCLIGIPLLLSQVRLHYFGTFALLLPPLMAASAVGQRYGRLQHAVLAVTAAFAVVSYWVPIRDRLFVRNMPANDVYYSFSSMAMPALAEACRQNPGIVLANNNDGHYIRYHTDCSVISNNFLVTKQHEEKALETTRLLGMTPDLLLASGVPVMYVLARASGLLMEFDDGRYELVNREMAASVTGPLVTQLLWSDPATLGGHWEMLQEWRTPGEDGFVFMRLWRTGR